MQKRIIFTKQGLVQKQQEYQDLLNQRPLAVKDLAKAREMGDLSENGYYKSARMKLSDIDRRLRQLKHVLKIATIQESANNGLVDVGSRVTVKTGDREKTYEIVGTYEANPSLGKISLDSPLGKLLIGKRVGDTVELKRENGSTIFAIIEVN